MESLSASAKIELESEFLPFLRVYKDGRVERLVATDFVPPSLLDPTTRVSSKDLLIIPETGVSARLYLPNHYVNSHGHQIKLPLLIYFHGGGFCVESPFSRTYHNYLNSLVAEANVVAVSVDYRLAPEYPIPCAYEDSWAAFKWALSHSTGMGSEAWLNDYSDFGRVFLAGDSAGANICHHLAMRAGQEAVKVVGVALVHPYFLGGEGNEEEAETDVEMQKEKAKAEKMWWYACGASRGCGMINHDLYMNPMGYRRLEGMGCERVVAFVAEKDYVKRWGGVYCEKLRESGWSGVVEMMETEGEKHVFHLRDPCCEKAVVMRKRFAEFLNRG